MVIQAATSLTYSLDDYKVVDAHAHVQQTLDIWLTLRAGRAS